MGSDTKGDKMKVRAVNEDMKEVFPCEMTIKEVKKFALTDDMYKFEGVFGWFLSKDFEIVEE